jgi:tRNA pseudouridine65 synthase
MPVNSAMQLLYLDSHLVAVNKPSGLLVHRTAIDRRETRFALQMTRDLLGQRVFPVHRLDKPASGVLLFALDATVARAMTDQFAAGAVRKDYLAVVRGHVDTAGTIDYALREELDPLTDGRAEPGKAAQIAVTEYRCIRRCELPYPVGRYATARYSLVQAIPKTGRKHQIRRHMKHIFHPIVGDTTHGDGRQNALFRARFGVERLLLHARGMAFAHPVTGQPLSILAPLAEEFARLVAQLGWDASLH